MDTGTVSEGKTMAIISYITFIGTLIAFIMNQNKKNSFASFHIRQAIGLLILAFVVPSIADGLRDAGLDESSEGAIAINELADMGLKQGDLLRLFGKFETQYGEMPRDFYNGVVQSYLHSSERSYEIFCDSHVVNAADPGIGRMSP